MISDDTVTEDVEIYGVNEVIEVNNESGASISYADQINEENRDSFSGDPFNRAAELRAKSDERRKRRRESKSLYLTRRRPISFPRTTASQQKSFEFLGCPELEAFVSCAGGAVDKSKREYLKLLHVVYEIIARISAKETDMGKSSNDHAAIFSGAFNTYDKLGKNVLVFSGTSDNEPNVALGVDYYLNFRNSVRCICHTLALCVNSSVLTGDFIYSVLGQISNISTYVNQHTKVQTKLVKLQCLQYDRGRIDVDVFREVSRVAWALEADRRASASRAPRFLKELHSTLDIFAASRDRRSKVLLSLQILVVAQQETTKSCFRISGKFSLTAWSIICDQNVTDDSKFVRSRLINVTDQNGGLSARAQA
eukprot:IDg14900t1